MYKVFIATTSFAQLSDEPLNILKKNNLKIYQNNLGRKLSENDILEYANGAKGIIAGTEPYTERVLINLKQLKIISRLGVGLDNIKMKTADLNGIKIFKTCTTPALAVSELTIGLILDLLRKINLHHMNMITGIWKKQMGSLLSGKTIGIIGLGTIGKTLVKLLSGVNLKILAYDIFQDEQFQKQNDVTYCDLGTLLKESDIVTIHLNLSDQTKKLIGNKQFSLMKKNAIIINTSRGEILDNDALYNALNDKIISGAGLDVYDKEPYKGPLTNLENIVLTPHIGSYAKEVRIQMEIEAAQNLIKGLNSE